jgi:two-component system NtrC family response regulator
MTAAIRILLVEDDAAVRDGFRAALEGAGFSVEAVEDGADGLARLSETPGAFRAVITDVNLPSLSGPDMIAKAGASLGRAAVIYLSGFAADGAWPGGQVLSKPIGKDDLVRVVREATR